MKDNLEKELDVYIDEFIRDIKFEARSGFESVRKEKIPSLEFPIFSLSDETFCRNKYLNELIIWRLRTRVINPVFNYLFKQYGYDIYFNRDVFETYGGFTNETNEISNPIVFFILDKGEYIAFKYSDFIGNGVLSYDYRFLESNFKQVDFSKIKKVVSIIWKEKSNKKPSYNDFKVYEFIEDIFEKYFSIEEYSIFITKVKNAVRIANELIGFHTTSRLITKNKNEFKEVISKQLYELKYENLVYTFFEKNELINEVILKSVFDPNELESLDNNFKGNNKYLLMTGNSDYSDSFITAEYLFKVLESNMSLDYSSIVMGYFKSVEQLCNKLVEYFLERNNKKIYCLAYTRNSLLKCDNELLNNNGVLLDSDNFPYLKRIDNHNYVSIDKKYERFRDKYDLSLGNLLYFFLVNKNEILTITDNSLFFKKIIDNYTSKTRNVYLHKENIDDFNVVKKIRDNTYVLVYILLGSIKLENSSLEDLGMLDNSFEKLFKKIYYMPWFRYELIFDNELCKKTIRVPERIDYDYDKSGNLMNCWITFLEVDEFPNDYPEYKNLIENENNKYKQIKVDKYNMPKKIFKIDNLGNKKEIFF